MRVVFGDERVRDFCICNAWKYRARARYKGNEEEDLKKADWYINAAHALGEGNMAMLSEANDRTKQLDRLIKLMYENGAFSEYKMIKDELKKAGYESIIGDGDE